MALRYEQLIRCKRGIVETGRKSFDLPSGQMVLSLLFSSFDLLVSSDIREGQRLLSTK